MRDNIGNNSHGNNNEKDFVNSLNKGLSSLNLNLKRFIQYICGNEGIEYDSIIEFYAEYEPDNRFKQDCYIIINGNKYGISLKMGNGNSVHQEKCSDFVDYIKKTFNANDKICNLWKFFLWADGTLDGSGSKDKDSDGNIKSRFTATMFKKTYPDKREKLQQFINKNESKLIEHFLFEGRHNSKVDYIYHGTVIHGSWISKKKILDYQIRNSSTSGSDSKNCLSVGKMSIQSWNVSRKGTSEGKRGQIQIKYGKMRDDFSILMSTEKGNIGTFDGDSQEFNLSQIMNKNKKHKFWERVIDDINHMNYFVVKVSKKPISKLSGKKVFPKSDAYIINANLDSDFMLKREYVLTEDDLENIDYKIVPNTGISIKIKESSKYTIQKFTKDSFVKAFSKVIFKDNIDELIFALLIYSKDKEIHKNEKIAHDLGINYGQFIESKKQIYMGKNNFNSMTEKELLDTIRRDAQIYLKKAIESDDDLLKAIFTGEGWFDDPYYAKFIFVHGDLVDNKPTDFSITTGSGRSSGKYSIEIKPQSY